MKTLDDIRHNVEPEEELNEVSSLDVELPCYLPRMLEHTEIKQSSSSRQQSRNYPIQIQLESRR